MINGIINVYKEKGYTSFDVVAKMRGIAHQKKIGHTGTLDPDAEGVLPLCLGKATKVCDLLTDKDKVYEAVLLLGVKTDTLDISGEILEKADVNVNEEMVNNAIMSFVGQYEQVPPMYSALKVNGKKLYELAREGVTVERKARRVNIFSIEIIDMNLPEVRFRVHCSKGTYIRSLCDDIGDKLGCYGCMKSLVRTRVSEFSIENALKLEEIERLFKEGNLAFIMPVDSVFMNYPSLKTKEEAYKIVVNGNKIPAELLDLELTLQDQIKESDRVRVYDHQDKFVGIYEYIKEFDLFKPVKLFMEE